MRLLSALLGLLFVIAPATTYAAAGDVPGSKDHPAVSRYPDSVIRWHRVENHRPYKIAVGPVTGYKAISDWVETEGRVTRVYYELTGERTHSEVYANYKKALVDEGFEILADGMEPDRNVGKKPGGRSWMGVHYGENPTADEKGVIVLLKGSSSVGGSAFVAGKKERAEGTIYVAVGIAQHSDEKVAILVDVIEEEAAETDLIVVDADAMGDDIDEHGRVALYGLYFDHDKATLTPDSKPALDEIAKFLKARPGLNVYVVGHTDATGTTSYNLSPSLDRAREVAGKLAADYGIDKKRLEPHGVGPLAPIFTNQSDRGRAKNRRVELVERLR